MAIIDVVKWDGSPDVFAYKFPEENLTTFTQLIVNESQEAVLFHKGKLVQKFGPGKHVLSTENIPVLENLYGIPFGGKNPFTAEVWFVNKVMVLNMKWGTKTPIQLRDPEYKVMVPVRAYGQFGVQIADAATFLVKLVGTLPVFNQEELTECFRGLLLTKISTVIARKIIEDRISVLDIAAYLQTVSEMIGNDVREEFGDYGVKVLNFFVNSINVAEEDPAVKHLKELLSRKAEMDLLGYDYKQERSFDVLENAARNEGMAGSVMGAGMGMGMGFGVGGMMGGMMNEVGQQIREKSINCPHCQTPVKENALFCPVCGQKIKEGNGTVRSGVVCDKCGKPIPANSRFCPHCGDTYNPCPKCGADNDANAAVCRKCGEPMPEHCSGCGALLFQGAKFCSECGTSVQCQCPHCKQEIRKGFKFCPVCGGKIEQ